MKVLEFATISAGLLLFVLTVLLAYGDYQLVVRLRRDHSAIWRSLGSPSPWFTKFEHLSAMNRFLGERQYEALNDATLSALSAGLRLLTRLVYYVAATTLLAIAAVRLAR